jgi:hypothetical protein
VIYWPTEMGMVGMPTIWLSEEEYATIKAAFDGMDQAQTFIRDHMVLA